MFVMSIPSLFIVNNLVVCVLMLPHLFSSSKTMHQVTKRNYQRQEGVYKCWGWCLHDASESHRYYSSIFSREEDSKLSLTYTFTPTTHSTTATVCTLILSKYSISLIYIQLIYIQYNTMVLKHGTMAASQYFWSTLPYHVNITVHEYCNHS